ncbi:MAG: Flagellar hook-length control protein FliK [Betaproteobacteria bacterium ADurb.Bin341]|nr:MAG: Flagellar hook-length control protein FliK [Betaproteobacteria bacterium ADurb.Bin341]
MIPPDAASRLRLTLPDQPLPTQPVPATQKLADALGELVPGQRLLAQIQSLLPNGTYRAVVGQREITLALPFSAKNGDVLELEVTETKGRATLAFVANRGAGETGDAEQQSVATRLSQTGKMIGDLLTGIGKEGSRAQPAALNGNQPLIAKMPQSAAELVPLLKEALAKSGMFYEAHQARWVEGKLPTAVLLQEPQGKLSPAPREAQPQRPETPNTPTAPAPASKGAEEGVARTPLPTTPLETAAAARPNAAASPIHPQLVPLVQQQLDALSTQTYLWQGQAWPGQNLYWEISEDGSGRQSGEDETAERWQTRMALNLPKLGGVEARIRLRSGDAIDIILTTDSEETRNKLAAASNQLRQKLGDSGLVLTSCQVDHVQGIPVENAP